MPKTISHALRNRLTRSANFRRLLEDLHAIFGVECLFLDPLGYEKVRFPREHKTPLHHLESYHPDLHIQRQQLRQAQLSGSSPPGDLPWIEIHTTLQIQEEIIGYLILSAWRNEADSGESLKHMWIQAAQQGASSSWEQWRKAWQALPTCNDRQQDAIARTLRLFADEALHHAESETLSTPKPSKLPPVIQKACTLIQEEYAQPLNLKQVAARCHISPEHLSRLFHHSTGMLFRDYLAETRIQAVCHLLNTSTDSISDIAANTGFSTLSRFNRSFRESTGTTPRQWRKHHLKKSPDRASPKK